MNNPACRNMLCTAHPNLLAASNLKRVIGIEFAKEPGQGLMAGTNPSKFWLQIIDLGVVVIILTSCCIVLALAFDHVSLSAHRGTEISFVGGCTYM
jgi:hypothetical protein